MNKKAFHSFEEFTQAWKQETIPEPRRVEERFHSGSRPSCRRKRVSAALLSVCLLLAAGTALSAAIWDSSKLRNKQGEVVFSYGQTSPEQMAKDARSRQLFEKYRDIRQDAEVNAAPGEMNYLLITELYELDHYFYAAQKKNVFTSPQGLQAATVTDFQLPAYVPAKLAFLQGIIQYEAEPVVYQEAKRAGLAYIVRPAKLKPEALDIYLEYGGSPAPDAPVVPLLRIGIRPEKDLSLANMTASDASHKAYEIVTIKGQEALYIKDEKTLYLPMQTEQGGLIYEIRSVFEQVGEKPEGETGNQPQPVSREELVKVAASLLGD
jgi:hypothetical protein